MPRKPFPKEIKFFEVERLTNIGTRAPKQKVPETIFGRLIAHHPKETIFFSADHVTQKELQNEFPHHEVQKIQRNQIRKKYPEGYINQGIVGSHGAMDFLIDKNTTLEESIGSKGFGEKFKNSFLKQRFPKLSPQELDIFFKENRISFLYLEGREIPPEHQGKGIGKRFLEELERIAREQGVNLMQGDTKNPYAIKTYEALGWIKLGVDQRGSHIFVKWLD